MTAKQEANKLRSEAKENLHRLFNIPQGFGSEQIDRAVDCIIGAAILEVSALVDEAASSERGPQ